MQEVHKELKTKVRALYETSNKTWGGPREVEVVATLFH